MWAQNYCSYYVGNYYVPPNPYNPVNVNVDTTTNANEQLITCPFCFGTGSIHNTVWECFCPNCFGHGRRPSNQLWSTEMTYNLRLRQKNTNENSYANSTQILPAAPPVPQEEPPSLPPLPPLAAEQIPPTPLSPDNDEDRLELSCVKTSPSQSSSVKWVLMPLRNDNVQPSAVSKLPPVADSESTKSEEKDFGKENSKDKKHEPRGFTKTKIEWKLHRC